MLIRDILSPPPSSIFLACRISKPTPGAEKILGKVLHGPSRKATGGHLTPPSVAQGAAAEGELTKERSLRVLEPRTLVEGKGICRFLVDLFGEFPLVSGSGHVDAHAASIVGDHDAPDRVTGFPGFS